MSAPPARAAARPGTSSSVLPGGRGRWWFAAAGLVNALGTGSFLAFALPFFAHVSTLPVATVGPVLTVASLVVLPAMALVGRLAEAVGARALLTGAALVRASAFAGLLLWDGLIAFTALAMASVLGARAEQAGNPLMAARLSAGAARAAHGSGCGSGGEAGGDGELSKWIALSRTVFNAGVGGGATLSSVLIGAGIGYDALGVTTALAFLLSAGLYLPLPGPGRKPAGPSATETAGATETEGATETAGATGTAGATTGAGQTPAGARAAAATRGARPWRDPRFLRVSTAGALFFLSAVALESAIPVYLLSLAAVPSWLPGVLFALNTVFLTVTQLPVNRRLEKYPPSRLLLTASVLAAVSFPLFTGASLADGAAVAVLVTVVAMLGWTVSEMVLLQTVSVLLVTVPAERERSSFVSAHQISIGVASALGPFWVTSWMSLHPVALFGSFSVLCLVGGLLSSTGRAAR